MFWFAIALAALPFAADEPPAASGDVAPPAPAASSDPAPAPAPTPAPETTAPAPTTVESAPPAPAAPAPAAPAPAAAVPATVPTRARVFIAPLEGANTNPTTVDLIEDRVLVAARAAAPELEVLGARDVQGVLDAEAAKQALGCDSTSCANEIADALSAEQLVTGQLGRIGETWQLTLTRTERTTLRVLSRAQREARGETPERLLSSIDGQVRELFAAAPVDDGPSFLVVSGTVVGGLGAATAGVGAALWGVSWLSFYDAQAKLASSAPDVPGARKAQEEGIGFYSASLIVAGIGGVILAGGATLFAVGLVAEGGE